MDRRFLVADDLEPAYLDVYRRGQLTERVEAALAELAECGACPRNCGIDRLANETKVCNTGRHALVSSAFAHFGEEDCLRGTRGSGTIFFGMCNLKCVFCQNWTVSGQGGTDEPSESAELSAYSPVNEGTRGRGDERTGEQLADIMLELQAAGCHNINFVTPEHVAPQVVEAIAAAVPRGLRIPIVYNTSAYDALSSLALLDGLVDIYMPDFKFWTKQSAMKLAKAKDYPERARDSIREMHRQVGVLQTDARGVARRGVLVRHLVMPGQTDEAAAIFRWLADELSPDTYVNVMDQYHPDYEVGQIARDGSVRYASINRRPTPGELAAARAAAREAGLWRFDERG